MEDWAISRVTTCSGGGCCLQHQSSPGGLSTTERVWVSVSSHTGERNNLLKIQSTPLRKKVILVAEGAALLLAHQNGARMLLVLRNYDSLKVAKCLVI